jgi:hypothetical protein
MRTQYDALPDRSVLVHHLLRSAEKWYGFLFKVDNPVKMKSIQQDLDGILEKEGYFSSNNKESLLYCTGPYSPDTLKKIKKYVSTQKGLNSSTIFAAGKYEDFLGAYWVEDLKKKYRVN